MSYRNPKIIVDRSAEIYAGLANTGTSFFNSYMKASNAVKDATAKRNAGLLKAINKSTEKYENRIEKGINAAKIDDATLIEQLQAIADKKLNGSDGDIGIIKKNAMLNMGLINDPALRKQYRKDIREYKAWEGRSIQNAGGYEAQVEDYDTQVNSSTLGTTKQIAGQGTERFINLTAIQTLRQREVEGVDVSRTLTDDGDIIISGKIDMNSDSYLQYIKDGLIDPNDGTLKFNEKGIASFEWRSNAKNPVKNLLIDLLPTFDQSKASIAAGIETDRGDVDKNLYTGKRNTTTKNAGEGRVYDETKIYINPDIVKDNDVFNKEAKAFAEGVRTSSKDQQIDILNRIGVPIENQEKYLNDPASQANIITEALINDNIKRITGSPDVKEDSNGFYITEYSRDRAKPSVDSKSVDEEKTTTELKLEAFEEKITNQGGMQEFYKAFVKGPGSNAADTLNKLLQDLAIPNEVIQFQDQEGNVEQDIIKIDVAGKEGKIEIDVTNPEMAIAKLKYAISGDYGYVRELQKQN